MPHTVGLYGATGNLGAPTLKYLLQAHEAGKLHLVVLLRPSSAAHPDIERAGAEVRRIDVDQASDAEVEAAARGIAYFISTIGVSGYAAQGRLVEALAKSDDFVTMTPALYGRWWLPQDLERFPSLKTREEAEREPERRLGALGKGVTDVGAGVFGKHFLQYGGLGLDIQGNKLQANEGMLQNEFPITTLDYLGYGLAWVASQSPSEIANRKYTFISHWFTGEDLVGLLRKVNGAEPTVLPMEKEDIDVWEKSGQDGPIVAGYLTSWTEGREKTSYADVVYPPGYQLTTLLEEVAEAKRRLDAGID